MSNDDLVHRDWTELDLGHASQLAGDGARDVAGGDVGGRAPVFTHTQTIPDEGLEGGERAGLPGRAGLSGIYPGKPMIVNTNTHNNTYSPVYSSPPNNTFPLPLLDSRAPNPPYTGPQTGLGGVPREYTRYAQQRPKMAEPGPNGGRPMATHTHPAAQPVPLTARRQVQQVQQVPSRGPTWVDKGGPQKGGNYSYRKKTGNQAHRETGGPEVSTPQWQETGPQMRRQLGPMITPNHPKDSNVRRGNLTQPGMRPSCNREVEVGAGRAQLPQRSANVSKLSRRQTKREQRRPEVEALRQPNH